MFDHVHMCVSSASLRSFVHSEHTGTHTQCDRANAHTGSLMVYRYKGLARKRNLCMEASLHLYHRGKELRGNERRESQSKNTVHA